MHEFVCRSRVWGVVAALAIVVSACGGDSASNDPGASQELKEVSILMPFQDDPTFFPFAIAREMGYFEDEGLSVKVEGSEGSSFVTQQLLAGNIDYGMANSAADTIAYTKNAEIRVPSCFQQKLIYRMLVPSGSDVTSVSDLRGRTLGVTDIGGGEGPFAEAALGNEGLVPNEDVKILPIGAGGPQTRQAIESGQVDAYMASYTDYGPLTAHGMEFNDITPDNLSRIAGTCFVTTGETLDDPEKSEILIGIARAFAKGITFGIENPEAALTIACAQLPEACQDKELTKEFVDLAVDIATPSDPSVQPGGVDPNGWESAAEVLFDSGTIQQEVDAAVIIDSPDVQAARESILDFDADAIRQEARDYES